jgi:hypothetical protein
MPTRYRLEGKEAVPFDDTDEKSYLEWAQWFGTADRRVARTEVGDVEVSTVFLGTDHGFGYSTRPILFETMVFGGELNLEQERYYTWDEAESGHAAMVARVMAAQRQGSAGGSDG